MSKQQQHENNNRDSSNSVSSSVNFMLVARQLNSGLKIQYFLILVLIKFQWLVLRTVGLVHFFIWTINASLSSNQTEPKLGNITLQVII